MLFFVPALKGQSEITKNDLIQLTKGKFSNAEAMEPAIEKLIEMNYIRREKRETKGRPAEFIVLNPEILSK